MLTGAWRPESQDQSVFVTEGETVDFVNHGPGIGVLIANNIVRWVWLDSNAEHTGTFSNDCETITWENDAQWFRDSDPGIHLIIEKKEFRMKFHL